MKSIFLLLLLASTAYLAAYEKEGDVLVLTDENLAQAIQEHDHLFVKFYAPWCPHCKEIAPKWTKWASELKGKVTFAKIDAEQHSKSGQEHNVF